MYYVPIFFVKLFIIFYKLLIERITFLFRLHTYIRMLYGFPLKIFDDLRAAGGRGGTPSEESGSLANRSTFALPRGIGCQHDISSTTNQPSSRRAGVALTHKGRHGEMKGSAQE